jgi:drug/metabolite transporter (DMT)-like permease
MFIAFFIRCCYMLSFAVYFPYVWLSKNEEGGVGLATILQDPAFARTTMCRMCGLTLASVVAGYWWYKSLTETDVPTNTIIYQLNVSFVLVVSVCFLGEKLTRGKVCAVAACFVGTAAAVLGSSDKPTVTNTHTHDKSVQNTPLGLLLVLGSTIVYAVYECSYDIFMESLHQRGLENRPCLHPFLFLGLLGLVTVLTCWPALLLFHLTGEEVFELPPDAQTWHAILLNGVLDAGFNMFLILGISNSSPLVISAGRCVLLFVLPR